MLGRAAMMVRSDRLQPAKQRIQVDVSGPNRSSGHARWIINLLQEVGEHRWNCPKSRSASPLRKAISSVSARPSNLLAHRSALVGHLGYLAGRADQTPVDGIACDDPGIVVHTNGGGQIRRQLRKVGVTADLVEPFAAIQLMRHRDRVDRHVLVPELQAGVVNPAILFAKEVVRTEIDATFVIASASMRSDAMTASSASISCGGRRSITMNRFPLVANPNLLATARRRRRGRLGIYERGWEAVVPNMSLFFRLDEEFYDTMNIAGKSHGHLIFARLADRFVQLDPASIELFADDCADRSMNTGVRDQTVQPPCSPTRAFDSYRHASKPVQEPLRLMVQCRLALLFRACQRIGPLKGLGVAAAARFRGSRKLRAKPFLTSLTSPT